MQHTQRDCIYLFSFATLVDCNSDCKSSLEFRMNLPSCRSYWSVSRVKVFEDSGQNFNSGLTVIVAEPAQWVGVLIYSWSMGSQWITELHKPIIRDETRRWVYCLLHLFAVSEIESQVVPGRGHIFQFTFTEPSTLGPDPLGVCLWQSQNLW